MKKLIITLTILISTIFTNIAFADLMVPNTHHINKCVKITNLNQFDNYTFLEVIKPGLAIEDQTYVIKNNECIKGFYHAATNHIISIPKEIFEKEGLEKVNNSFGLDDKYKLKSKYKIYYSNIRINPNGGYIYNSNKLKKEEIFYRILKISGNKFELLKYKEIKTFQDGNKIVKDIDTDQDGNKIAKDIDTKNLKNIFIIEFLLILIIIGIFIYKRKKSKLG